MTSSRPRRTNSVSVKETASPSSAHATSSISTRKRNTRDPNSSKISLPSSKPDKDSNNGNSDERASKQQKRERDKMYNANGEELFCSCNQPYDERRFMIGCDICDGWYHPRCINLTINEAMKIQNFVCPVCRRSAVYQEVRRSAMAPFTDVKETQDISEVGEASIAEQDYGNVNLTIGIHGETNDRMTSPGNSKYHRSLSSLDQ